MWQDAEVWSKCSKVRLHGKDTATCAYQMAATEHNIGYIASSLMLHIKDTTEGTLKALEMKKRKEKGRLWSHH